MVCLEEVLALDFVAEAIEGSGHGERVYGASVDCGGGYALDEIENGGEGAAFVARSKNLRGDVFADAFQGGYSETYVAVAVDTEFGKTFIDVGAFDADVHLLAFVDEARHFLGVVAVARKDCRHIFRRIVSLEVCRLESYPAVAGGMALVEGVGGEFFPVGPYFFEDGRFVAVFLSAFKEEGFQLVHLLDHFLTHRLAERVALATGEVGEKTRQKHDLLLIDRDAVGVLEIFLHDGNIIDNRFATMLAGDEIGDVVHGARTVEGIHGYEVFECGRLEFAEIFLHSGRLELECAGGAALAIELIGLGVVDGDFLHVDVDSPREFYVLDGFLDDGECLQPEEVHFYQSGFFDDTAFILRHDDFFLGIGTFIHGGADGDPVGDVVAADYDSAGMDARVSDRTFELSGELEGLHNEFIAGIQLAFEFVKIIVTVVKGGL